MTRRLQWRSDDDDGMALIIAILFITILALVVGLLVTGAGGNLQATVVAKQRTALVYTDDAAINWAINDARVNAVCATTTAGIVDLTSSLPASLATLNQTNAPPGNQQIQSLTCQDIGGSTSGGPLGQYALYTTDRTVGDKAITQKEGGQATVQGGDVFNRTGVWDISQSLIISQGNVIDGDKFSGTCPTSITHVTVVDGTITCVTTPSPPSVTSPSSSVPNCAPYWDTTAKKWIAESLYSGNVAQPTGSPPVYAASYNCATTPTGHPATAQNVDANANGRTNGTCQIFMPGMYTKAPVLSSDSYFVSGTYYFDFNGGGTWTISNNSSLFGGEQGSDTKISTSSPCISALAGANDWDKTAATEGNGSTVDSTFVPGGTGVKWFFGGKSSLFVKNNASAELFDRVFTCSSPCSTDASGSTTEGAQDFSLLEVPSTSVASDNTGTWTTSAPSLTSFIWPTQSSPTQGSTTSPILQVAGGNNNTTVVHGAMWAPNSNVNLSATNQSTASIQGGIDAWSIDLNKSAAGADLAVGLPGNSGNRFVQFIAKGGVPGNPSSTYVVRSAVVFIDNDSSHTTFVKSWRSAS